MLMLPDGSTGYDYMVVVSALHGGVILVSIDAVAMSKVIIPGSYPFFIMVIAFWFNPSI
jgi:hypothetical protein